MSEPSPRHEARQRTWLWGAFAFVTLFLCSAAALILAVSGGQLPELGSGPSWTPPAPNAAEPVQATSPQTTASFAAGNLVVNASSGQVRLRKTPGFQNKPADDVITTVTAGAQGEIMDGPQDSDGLRWWRVRFGNQEGWMAERSSQGILLLDRVQ
jgi:hypothetical protein